MSENLYIVNKKKKTGQKETLGPFTAEEVRSNLKAGVLLPTDLVSRSGHPVQMPLIEMDEIFEPLYELKRASGEDSIYGQKDQASTQPKKPKAATTLSLKDRNRQASFGNEDTKIAQLSSTDANRRSKERIQSFSALMRFKEQPRSHWDGLSKKLVFFIQDHLSNNYGPFSGSDIVDFFRRGESHPSQSVYEPKLRKKVPIQKFVNLFEQVAYAKGQSSNKNRQFPSGRASSQSSGRRQRPRFPSPPKHRYQFRIFRPQHVSSINGLLFVISCILIASSILLGSFILSHTQLRTEVFKSLSGAIEKDKSLVDGSAGFEEKSRESSRIEKGN